MVGVPVDREARAVEGVLRGGCLSLLAATRGLAEEPDLTNSLLFCEEIDEPPYRVDRMLTQLGRSGSLKGLRGLLVGSLEAAVLGSDQRDLADLSEVFREAASTMGVALAVRVPSGHMVPNFTLPIGLGARLRPETSDLVVGLTDY